MIDERKRIEKEKAPSNKEFGFVFTAVFLLVAFLPLIKHHPIRWWAVLVAFVFLGFSLLAPGLLAPLAKVWMKFGAVIHKVMNPLILGFVFFLVFTPFGLMLRACGMKFLKFDWEKNTNTYWIKRNPPGLEPLSFKNQF